MLSLKGDQRGPELATLLPDVAEELITLDPVLGSERLAVFWLGVASLLVQYPGVEFPEALKGRPSRRLAETGACVRRKSAVVLASGQGAGATGAGAVSLAFWAA